MDPNPTRERLIAAMSDLLERRGFHGVGLSELLAQAQAPKGVLYHHFPGGKTALMKAAELGNPRIVELLLNAGAKTRATSRARRSRRSRAATSGTGGAGS